MRRSTVLSLPLQLVFPAVVYSYVQLRRIKVFGTLKQVVASLFVLSKVRAPTRPKGVKLFR
jgi:hypothetical protein